MNLESKWKKEIEKLEKEINGVIILSFIYQLKKDLKDLQKARKELMEKIKDLENDAKEIPVQGERATAMQCIGAFKAMVKEVLGGDD